MIPSWSSLVAVSLFLGQTGQAQVITPAPGGARSTYIYPNGTAPSTVVTTPTEAPRRWWSLQDRPILSRVQGWFGRGTPKAEQQPAAGTTTFSSPTFTSPTFATPTTINAAPTTVNTAPTTPLTPAPARTTPTTVTPTPTLSPAPGSDFPRKMPATTGKATTAGTEVVLDGKTTTKVIQPAAFDAGAKKSPILPGLANKIGRDEKFEWITGQLEIENGQHVIYYATPETVDPHHGRLVLQTKADLSQLRRGDLVSAHGQVARGNGILGGPPVYRATSVDLIEHGQR